MHFNMTYVFTVAAALQRRVHVKIALVLALCCYVMFSGSKGLLQSHIPCGFRLLQHCGMVDFLQKFGRH